MAITLDRIMQMYEDHGLDNPEQGNEWLREVGMSEEDTREWITKLADQAELLAFSTGPGVLCPAFSFSALRIGYMMGLEDGKQEESV